MSSHLSGFPLLGITFLESMCTYEENTRLSPCMHVMCDIILCACVYLLHASVCVQWLWFLAVVFAKVHVFGAAVCWIWAYCMIVHACMYAAILPSQTGACSNSWKHSTYTDWVQLYIYAHTVVGRCQIIRSSTQPNHQENLRSYINK